MMAAIFIPGGVPRLAFKVEAMSPSSDGVLSAGAGPPSPIGVSVVTTGTSSSIWMDDLSRSCMNMPERGCSRLVPNRARASVASLSHQRM
jgi:hypothetical protein